MTNIHQTSGRWQLGLGLSIITVSLWGILPIALKVTLQKIDVYTVTWFRFLVAFGLLAIYLRMRGQLPTLEKLRSTPSKLLAIAIIFLAANYICFLKGLALTSPANAEVMIQLAPILLGAGGLFLFQESYTLVQWLGVSIFTTGFMLFFKEQLTSLITSQYTYLLGSGLVVLGAVTWSIYALAQKQLLRSLSSTHIMLIIYGMCALIFTPFATINTIFTLNIFYLLILLFCAFNTLIAYGAFAESLEHWEASRVSAVIACAPIITLISVDTVSAIAPHLMEPERLTFIGMFGAILVVFGSMTIALGKSNLK
ncbi:MAG: DMT family transporter [Calothrix sp. MO_167.B12]|nr:DMT family transporter [Calothrix sp. MO_167.B12]